MPKEVRGAHPYCTPDACASQSGYFGTLGYTGQIDRHMFYGDAPSKETSAMTTHTSTSLMTSIRPNHRPQLSLHNERSNEDVLKAVQLAMSQ